MGERGPLPKRPEDRVRRNKTDENGFEFKTFELEGEVKPPVLERRFANKNVQALWEALKISVNRQVFEPVDWAYAKIVLTLWDEVLTKNEIPGAMLLTALDGMMSKLLVSEADRRRLKIEAKRVTPQVDDKAKSSDFYRQAFEEQQRARLRVVNTE